MSTYQNVKTISMPAGENLSGDQYELLTLNASGQVIKADAVTEVVIGILAENPGTTSAGDIVSVVDVQAGGIALVKANAAITAGNYIYPTTVHGRAGGSGTLVASRTSIGIALEAAAAAGEVIKVKLMVQRGA